MRLSAKLRAIDDEEIIVSKYPSPSLIRWIGDRSEASDTSKIDTLFEEQRALLESDAYEMLSEYLSYEECRKLLFSLCCSMPLRVHEFNAVNESMNSNHDIKLIVNLLIKSGILRKVGHSFRFYPDIKGDIYFSYSLNDEYDTQVLNFWINNSQSKTLENIFEASFINGMDIEEKLKPLIDEWACSKDYYRQNKNLEAANYIVKFAPESVLNLVYCYLEEAKSSNGGAYSRLTSDNFGPVLLELWKTSVDKRAILSILCEMELNSLDGIYDNFKVEGLTRGFFSPVSNRSEEILEALSIIKKWINEDKVGALEIFEYAGSEILRGSHTVTKTIINGVQYGQRVLNVSEEAIQVRRSCISIIEDLVNNKLNHLSAGVIESICNNLGNLTFGSTEKQQVPLDRIFETERAFLTDLFGRKLINSMDIASNIILERILMNWWAVQCPGCQSTEAYLLEFIRDGRYLFAKYYTDVDYRVVSFDDIMQIAPAEQRWEWFVDEVTSNTTDKRDDSRRIAKMLDGELATISELYALLILETGIIEALGQGWSRPGIIEEWCKLNSDLFIDYARSDYYKMSEGFIRAAILRGLVTLDEVYNKEIIDSFLGLGDQLSAEEIYSLLQIASNETLDDAYVVSMIQQLINYSTHKHMGTFIHRLFFIFKNREQSPVNNILINIIHKCSLNESTIDMLDFILRQFINNLKVGSDFRELKEIILSKLYICKKFAYHENKIIETLLSSEDEAIAFIGKRVENFGEDYFHQIPYDGFSFLKKFILDIVSFDSLICNLIELQENNNMNVSNISLITKPLFMNEAQEGGTIGTNLLKRYCVECNEQGVLILMDCFVLDIQTVEVFVEILVFLSDRNMQKEAEKYLNSHLFPEGCWSKGIGEDSPELLDRISLYSEIHQRLPYGRLKLVVEGCIDYLRKRMKEDLIFDEEVLNPR